MVKADAYGHGAIEVSRALRAAGAPFLGVSLIEEGVELRESGDDRPVLLFGLFGPSSVDAADAILEFDLTPVISEWHQLEALVEALAKSVKSRESLGSANRSAVKIHFKFNTGMNRLGFEVDQAPRLEEWLRSHPQFVLEGVCTHLLRGDDAGIPGGESESQLTAFVQAVAAFKGRSFHAHALNSSATVSLWHRVCRKAPLGSGATWPLGSRPGIGLYGILPPTDEGVDVPLVPALRFKSHLVAVRRLKPGERVSYNGRWRAARESLIGVVPVGYGDGYFRLLSGKASVLCRGKRAPVIGTICMDYFMIDLTEVARQAGPVEAGEEIVLIGEQQGERILARELAELAGTIPYEILTNISRRVPRVHVNGVDGR